MGWGRFKHPGEFLSLVLAAFLLGIALHSIWPFAHWPDFLLAGGLGLCVVMIFSSRENVWQFRICIIACAFLVGVMRFNATIPLPGQGIPPFIGKSVMLTGRIMSQSGSSGRIAYVVKIDVADGQSLVGQGRGVYVRSLTGAWPGMRVEFKCVLRVPGTFPANLERRRSLARKGIWAECAEKTEFNILALPHQHDPLFILSRLRQAITKRISEVLPVDEATLVTGILYGDQDLAPQLKDLFQRAGLMHLVAVSGSNVTIVVGVLIALALALGLPRRSAFWLISAGLLIFVGFVGFSASVGRAAFMGWLAVLARELGRAPWTDRLLLTAAAFLNLLNPWSLGFDAGFALSFLATWGLLVWTPIFERHLSFLPRVLSLRSTAATTCGATLMTAPYLAWAFGRLSLAGLVTNLIALPLVPWTMLWGAICAVWGNLPGAFIASAPALGLAKSIILISKIADAVPWLSGTVTNMSFNLLGATYLAIFYLWTCLREKTAVDSCVRQRQMSDSADNLKFKIEY